MIDRIETIAFPRLGIHRWADLTGVITLIMLAVGGLTWGMKLEARVDQANAAAVLLTERIARVEVTLTSGRMQVVEERLRADSADVEALKADVRELRKRDADTLDRLNGRR